MKNAWEKNKQDIDKVVKKINDIRKNSKIGTPFFEIKKKTNPYYNKYNKLKGEQIQLVKKKIRNKNFFYKKRITSYGKYGGVNYEAQIFKNSKTGLQNIGKTKWNTASYYGEGTEVFQKLVQEKLLPKELLNVSKGTHGGGGYYSWELKEAGLNIKEI